MTKLTWIPQTKLESHLKRLLDRIQVAYDEAASKTIKNVQDPFSLLCLAYIHKASSTDDLISLESNRSISSAISSAVGDFHQNVLGSVVGFENHDAGYDIENPERKILAEIKNKHNTMNKSARTEVESGLTQAVRTRPGYTGYLVIIIPRKPERYCNKLSKNVYEIDGTSFYSLATDSDSAIHDLYAVVEDLMSNHISSSVSEYCRSKLSDGIAP